MNRSASTLVSTTVAFPGLRFETSKTMQSFPTVASLGFEPRLSHRMKVAF